MRTIKFRGIDAETGKIVFGEVVHYDSENHPWWMHTAADQPNSPLKPETIAQLIGVDEYGCEIYEGDKVCHLIPEVYRDDDDNIVTRWRRPPADDFHLATFSDYDGILKWEIAKCE